MKQFFLYILLALPLTVLAQKPFSPSDQNYKTSEMVVHDPVLAIEGDTYYMFSTGIGITVSTSTDGMESWHFEKPIFDKTPDWVKDQIPEFDGNMWAPDVIFFEGRWHLFYVCSIAATNESLIGHISNKTLNPASSDYRWDDHGMVVRSIPGRDMWNAIDPNIIVDESGTPWMSFGSWWEGLKLVRMSPDLKNLAEPQEWHTISKRPRSFDFDDADPGDAPVEAPFIIHRGEYYYLFASFDYCCRGKDSTYKVVVGRSHKVTGPYLDKDGKRMDRGGGSIIVEGNKQWAGIGHNAAYTFDGKDYFISHAYAREDGQSYLFLKEMIWDKDGWPVIIY